MASEFETPGVSESESEMVALLESTANLEMAPEYEIAALELVSPVDTQLPAQALERALGQALAKAPATAAEAFEDCPLAEPSRQKNCPR
jgi:hypothetical protein